MSLPTTQITYRLVNNTDGPSAVKRFEEPLGNVDLDSESVLIKIKAVTLNYRDLMLATGQYPHPSSKNVIPGSDASGEVIRVGSAVKTLEVGDRVITNFNIDRFYGSEMNFDTALGAIADGVLTQYKVLPHYSLTKLPKDCHLSYEEAASLVCAGVTSWNSLFGSKDCFIPGQSVLMLGTGGVSVITLILAKAAGATTIITSSSDKKLKFLKEKYGFDHGINYKTHPDWEKEVLKVTDNKGVDFVLESGGVGTIEKSLACTKIGGHVSIFGFLEQTTHKPDVVNTIILKAITVRGVLVGSKELSEQLVRFVHAKKLPMPIDRTFGFSEEEVQAAYATLQSQSMIGKIAIKVD